MSLSKISGLILGSAALVAGHGYVSGIVVDDTYYGGYLVTEYPYESDPPELIAWSEQETDLGYIDGSEYANSNIICHKEAKPGALDAPVKAGGSVELQWTTWPTSHHGPVITYMANCNGDCDDVDKTTLEFFKIDQGGLISDTTEPGTWASDNLIANNNSRTVTVPSDIADGNYVLRHEIIALHSAEETNGAQNYPQCINLKVTGGGSATPSGTLGTALYKNTDPGILINIYTSLSTYDIPGPTLYTAGAAAATAASTAASSTAAAVTTADAVTTAAAVTTASAEVTSSPASVEVVPTTTPSSSIVSAFPTWSPSSTPPFSNSSNGWRPSFSRGPGGPRFTSAPAPQFSAPSGAQQKQSATATPIVATPVVITMTETSTSWVTEMVTLTDKSVVQTTSAVPVVVAVTTTIAEGSEPAQTASPSVVSGSSSESSGSSSSGSTSESSGSGSSSTATSKTSAGSDYVSSDWMSYLSSLSADEVLKLLRQTFQWMVSNDKVHARDITISN